MRVRLRVERGPRGEEEDLERGLFDGEAASGEPWGDVRAPPGPVSLIEHGHVLADVDHVLLQEQFRVAGGDLEITSTVRLEGHPLRSFAAPLRRTGEPGRLVLRFTDAVFKQSHEVTEIFEDPSLRHEFRQAVRHPHLMTPRHQRSLLFLVLLSAVWVWIVGLTLVAVVLPNLSVAWNVAFTLFFAALATNLFVPIPIEPVGLAALSTLGTGLTIAAAAAGKAAGAWIIFNLGPVLRRAMAGLEVRSAATRRVLAASERFARRFGYVALGLMLAVPFSPLDIVPIYLFSTLGLRLGYFLAAVFLGFATRLLFVILLGEAFLGLHG